LYWLALLLLGFSVAFQALVASFFEVALRDAFSRLPEIKK
jgi:hypothetical protein